jgi:hypothetical protein
VAFALDKLHAETALSRVLGHREAANTGTEDNEVKRLVHALPVHREIASGSLPPLSSPVGDTMYDVQRQHKFVRGHKDNSSPCDVTASDRTSHITDATSIKSRRRQRVDARISDYGYAAYRRYSVTTAARC